MSSIVLELQSDCLNNDKRVSGLLRKAKAVAAKLNLSDTIQWIEYETSGYPASVEIPDYREITGTPKALNPYHGNWLPIVFAQHDDIQEMLSKQKLKDSVSELEHLMKSKGEIFIPFSPSQITTLSGALEIDPTQMGLFIGRVNIAGIIDAIRNKILDWSLRLEKIGILGSGLTFTNEEKEIAQSNNIVYNIDNIENLHGVIGSVSGNSTGVSLKVDKLDIGKINIFLDKVQQHKVNFKDDISDSDALDQVLAELQKEIDSTNPNSGKIKNALLSLRSILEGASGNVAAVGLLELLKSLF